MFMNADGLATALKVMMVGIVILTGVVVAHLAFVWRLAHSPALAARPRATRIGLVTAAALTPILSFYAAEIAALRREGDARRCRGLAIIAGTMLGLTALFAGLWAAILEGRYVAADRDLWHWAERSLRLGCFLVLLQALVFMILRVLGRVREHKAAWLAVLALATLLILLLV